MSSVIYAQKVHGQSTLCPLSSKRKRYSENQHYIHCHLRAKNTWQINTLSSIFHVQMVHGKSKLCPLLFTCKRYIHVQSHFVFLNE